MIVNNNPKFQTAAFGAKIKLKSIAPYIGTSAEDTTPLDTLLKTNKGIKTIENITLFLKGSVDNRFFQGKHSFAGSAFHYAVNTVIMKLRRTSRLLFKADNYKELKQINKTFMKYDENSPEYIEELAKMGNSADKKFIVTNMENNPLEAVCKSNTAAIFVMNHPNYHRDKYTYAIINSILNKLYVKEGKQAECPRPKIIVSKNMLNAVGENIGRIYKKLGMIPVDAGIEHRDKIGNAFRMKRLLIDFANDRVNPFIFPEGRNCMKNMPLEKRIQAGVAAFINKSLNIKHIAKIVPVGIKYTDDADCYGKIFFGSPVYVKKSGSKIKYTHGVEKRKILQTDSKNAVSVILSEICENLKYCIEKADKLT